jgi:hypothetical protein
MSGQRQLAEQQAALMAASAADAGAGAAGGRAWQGLSSGAGAK